MSSPIVYLNGQYLHKNDATISIFDRGFLFADGVYEAIPYYQSHPVGEDEHLDRLENSLAAIHMAMPLSKAKAKQIIRELLQQNQLQDQDASCYIQITRGGQDARSHVIPDDINATVLFWVAPIDRNSIQHNLQHGIKTITVEDQRRTNCFIKAVGLQPNSMALTQAHKQGAQEAIFIRDGQVMEACASSLFMVKDGVVYTPPLDGRILPGITRLLTLQGLAKNNIPLLEQYFSKAELYAADEVWITSSIKEICPVVQIDDNMIANGKPGPIWQIMINDYQGLKHD